MHRDPHDALLLTNRPTTVVTQATRLLDAAQAPYGSQEDEESIFAGIGAGEDTFALRTSAADAARQLTSKVPGLAVESEINPPMSAPAQVKPSIWPPILVVGALLGIVALMSRK